MAPQQQKHAGMERHVQTILLSVITASILWFAASVAGLREDMARIQERLAQVTGDLTDATHAIKALANNSATKAEHDRDMARVGETLTDHERRLRRIETERLQR